MMNKLNYIILSSANEMVLETKVLEKLNDGYLLAGGISVVYKAPSTGISASHSSTCFYQAMIKQ